ncbi:MAG: MEDS domain-containing protein [Actinobacteria bacterium]|nr:MEDS domain-containing protein [Actinomycetota bacterium]
MSLTWTDAPAAHAAQIYVEAGELADSVAEYFAAGFEAGEPAVLVATEEHANLIADRLDAVGWNARRIEELGLLVNVNAEATLGRILEGPHPSPVLFERVIGGLLDQLGARYPGRRVRAFGEMVNVLCERGQRDVAVELEELWNRLARTRDFTLLCGYRLDVFDRMSQVETLPDVCRLHTHVAPGPDVEKLAHAVDDALVGVLGTPGAGQVYSLVGAEIRERRVPPSQLALMWVSENMPLSAERILAAARTRYRDAPASATLTPAANGAARRPVPDAWLATLRKATRTRRLS